MLRAGFILLIFLHGIIHLIGFAKAFQLGNAGVLSKDITKPLGVTWLIATLLFAGTAVLFLLKRQEWWLVGFLTVIISQALIISAWQDAKYGSIANVIVLLGVIAGFGQWQFEKRFFSDAVTALEQSNISENNLITETDLQHLPVCVQTYLRYVGVVNKPKVRNMRLVFEGRMRDKGKDWFPLESLQYNFYDLPARLFFMNGRMFGIDVPGYHNYTRGVATMEIKLFGLYPLISNKGKNLNKAETVTLFNDMCFFAPATLIDSHTQWYPIDAVSAKAEFTCNGITISAILLFNQQGQLVNFISEDRYAIGDNQQYKFSTPVKDYKNMGGYNLPTFAEAIWHYPEGPFAYGEFRLKEIAYNVNHISK